MNKLPVWIDCDTGVDDAIALLVAHRLDTLQIVGISTVAGNVPLEKTTRNTLKLCDLMGADYPVYPGAAQPWLREYHSAVMFHGEDGLGGAVLPEPSREAQSEPAWDALYRTTKQYPGTLELVAVGPLTNVATALVTHPELPQLLHRIVIMGGAAVGGNTTPSAEFNIYADPDAAQTVFRSGVPIVMCGLDVTLQAYLTPADLDEIGAHGTAVTRFTRECTHTAEHFCHDVFGLPGVSMHDTCPLMYLAHPELFSGQEAGVFVETQGDITLGKTVTDLYSDHQFEEKNALVLLKLDRDAFLRHLKAALYSYQ